MIQLLLLGTSGCHLCEQAQEIINACLPDNHGITIEIIDIAEQDQWQEKYAIRIPVLYHPETQKELGWPFNEVQIKAFIKLLGI
ncbi:glutaredoxin family protein [Methylobacter sp. S3L5C]|uniref:glutaredoxin family protein n=1 Tax=Methylobacter sp. S3L5C TaxID=2839024 RepID=UPI001FABC402|nr:glutaredoxin family protein [Methylobacter sp. S3L5C]UOA08103.1 glutaredoxin family protein [Methylobacter sp. S3L5C]